MDKLLRLDEYFRVSTLDFVFLSFCYGIYIYKKTRETETSPPLLQYNPCKITYS